MDIPGNLPPPLVTRQTVTVKTENGPETIEVVLAGIIAATHQTAKPDESGAVVDKKI